LCYVSLKYCYGGYVPGVKSENLYGKTYGKTSFSSAANDFNRGIDLPVNAKFATTTAETMLDHAQGNHKTTAQIVGVHREEDCYTKVSNKITELLKSETAIKIFKHDFINV
jgi:hypothetical protein